MRALFESPISAQDSHESALADTSKPHLVDSALVAIRRYSLILAAKRSRCGSSRTCKQFRTAFFFSLLFLRIPISLHVCSSTTFSHGKLSAYSVLASVCAATCVAESVSKKNLHPLFFAASLPLAPACVLCSDQ